MPETYPGPHAGWDALLKQVESMVKGQEKIVAALHGEVMKGVRRALEKTSRTVWEDKTMHEEPRTLISSYYDAMDKLMELWGQQTMLLDKIETYKRMPNVPSGYPSIAGVQAAMTGKIETGSNSDQSITLAQQR